MSLELNIPIGAPSSIATPSSGQATKFLNTDFSPPKLYYKTSDDLSTPYPLVTIPTDNEDCCCELVESIMNRITCGVESGTVSMEDFQIFINAGLTVVGNRTDDGQGNVECTVDVRPAAPIAVTGISTLPATINPLAVASQAVIIPTITPSSATNKTVYWSSSNVTKATVDQNGVVTGIATGSAIITATTADGGFTDTTTVTVP